MDYKRVYAEFIKDRREKEAHLEGYSERHHIVPRCMGGGDEAENLIRLTAEDHFFAHLVLAKIHGGKMWAPVAFMVGGQRKDYKPIISRGWYGWASRAMARSACGENAHQYDWTIYVLEHKDGRRWSGTQSEMHSVLGLGKPLANLLIKRKVGSAKGWFHLGERPKHVGRGSPSGIDHNMYRHESVSFVHVDGRRFSGTQFEFHLAHSVSKSAACNLARGKVRVVNGWYVEGRPPVRKGRGARWLRPDYQEPNVI